MLAAGDTVVVDVALTGYAVTLSEVVVTDTASSVLAPSPAPCHR